MVSPHDLAPLLVNAKTGEPYLPLHPPHSNIILTPPRLSDAEAIVPILNDKRVWMWLDGPPYPYYLEHAKLWLEQTSKESETLLRELRENHGSMVGGCPVRILREVKEDGEEIFLGDCGISRHLCIEVGDKELKERLLKENKSRPHGDPDIVWAFGDYLVPSHHGRGIMTATLRTLIDQWVIPRMGAKKITCTAFKGNKGSVKVFEKNGFVLEQTLDNWRVIPESKGGGKIGLHVLQWGL